MLEALGDDYIADYIRNYIRAEQEERRYKRYIADGLYALTNGYKLKDCYTFRPYGADLPPPDENEIKARILKKLRS